MRNKEGRRIKSGNPMDAVSPFLMPTRTGASNSFANTIDIGKCEQLIRKLREEGMPSVGMMHIFMATYVRMVSQLPGINRFIRGQRLYARNGIEICLTIKKEMQLNAAETVVKLYASPQDTLKDIYNKLSFMSYAPMIFISAKTGQRVNKLFEMINSSKSKCDENINSNAK